MAITGVILLTLSLVCGFGVQSQREGWRGIVPAQSTRTEVERLLGPPSDDCKCAYYLNDVNVFFAFSSSNCKADGSEGWNVPLDTILRIIVYPKPHPRFSQLPIDKTKFEERHIGHIENIVSYMNESEGLRIEVNAERDLVSGFYYGPAAKYQHLRCTK